jgi:hypothetical protein
LGDEYWNWEWNGFGLDSGWMRELRRAILENWNRETRWSFGSRWTRLEYIARHTRGMQLCAFGTDWSSPARKDSKSWKRASPSSEEVSHRLPPERYNGKSRRSCEPSHHTHRSIFPRRHPAERRRADLQTGSHQVSARTL